MGQRPPYPGMPFPGAAPLVPGPPGFPFRPGMPPMGIRPFPQPLPGPPFAGAVAPQRPPQLPRPGLASPPAPSSARPEKSTTVYVGKIASSVEDSVNLLVKCNTATQRYIDDYNARKEAEAVQKRKREAEEAAAQAADGTTAADVAAGPSADAATEAELEKERKRDRQEAEKKLRTADMVYSDALKQWERWERKRVTEADREHEREKDITKERQRAVKADAEALSDTETEEWRRPLYTSSQRCKDRKRRREKEDKEDTLDREAEEVELAAAAPIIQDDIADGMLGNGELSPPSDRPHSASKAQVDVNDPIYQAMIAAAKAPSGTANSHPHASKGTPDASLTPPHTALSPAHPGAANASKAGGRKRGMLAAFGAEEEEEQPKRRLIPLQYTEEELRAAQEPMQTEEATDKPATPTPTPTAVAAMSAGDVQKALKNLIRSIPSEKPAIFAHPISWASYDSGRAQMAGKILAWVKKKLTEIMGAEEESLSIRGGRDLQTRIRRTGERTGSASLQKRPVQDEQPH
ncbi:hypothetical protein WJX73_000868 [Symbiochloris irregularis]|uniref:Uncharacterized protein n=1 Tax=Symbiochloris irregularis TaxID=706552 RepID=A0AAW1PK59_9CHLO